MTMMTSTTIRMLSGKAFLLSYSDLHSESGFENSQNDYDTFKWVNGHNPKIYMRRVWLQGRRPKMNDINGCAICVSLSLRRIAATRTNCAAKHFNCPANNVKNSRSKKHYSAPRPLSHHTHRWIGTEGPTDRQNNTTKAIESPVM